MRRVLLIAALIVALGAAYYFTTGRGSEICTVCLSFQARTHCATKAANSSADAVERARRAACNEASPTDAGRATCFQSPPTSVQCKTR